MSAAGRPAPPVSVGATPREPGLTSTAQRLADELALPFSAMGDEPPGDEEALCLLVTPRGLELREATHPDVRGVRVDLRTIVWRPRTGSARRQPLARAMGAGSRTVLDATAGLGGDAALLAFLGFRVVAVERSPVVFALLRDGVTRAYADERCAAALDDRLRVQRGDARDVLAGLGDPPDVVYIDPMFPPKRRASALAKKDIRVVRALVGDDPDAASLLEVALAHARRRVVVKRPTKAAPLGAAPAASIRGKLVRYDVYPTV